MRRKSALCLAAISLLAGCTNFQQQVYNCTNQPVVFDGAKLQGRSFFGRRTGLPPYGQSDLASLPDGRKFRPAIVKAADIAGFDKGGLSNDEYVALVCPHFEGQVLIVNLD
ncbi:MAG: hypothetical protein AB7G25_16155 [Sphingomonadaceae bacterium]